MTQSITWQGRKLAFVPGENVASALQRAGIWQFGALPTGQAASVFCGIGQCQGCLIRAEDQIREACVLACKDGLTFGPVIGAQDV